MSEEPVRTCVGCRQTATKDDLLRFVKTEAGDLRVDVNGRIPGRGAYVCLNADCLWQALKKGGFGRSFRSSLRYTDARDVARQVAESLHQEAQGVLGFGKRGSTPTELGVPWGSASTEALAWRVARWLRIMEELTTTLTQQNSKMQGRTALLTKQATPQRARPSHKGRKDGESSGV